jgi:hypothetical protein
LVSLSEFANRLVGSPQASPLQVAEIDWPNEAAPPRDGLRPPPEFDPARFIWHPREPVEKDKPGDPLAGFDSLAL